MPTDSSPRARFPPGRHTCGGDDEDQLDTKPEEIRKLIPYIKIQKKDKLALPFESEEEYEELCIRCGTCYDACPDKFDAVCKITGQVVPAPIPEEERTVERKGKEAG